MKFSITIPTYKQKYLKEAVESVVCQTYTDWELIIVNDCSPEDIFSVVKPFLDDSRIHYYRNGKNCGAVDLVDNWNICLSNCTGDYVICMGDDDRLLPCCLEEYKKLMEKHPGLNVYHAKTEIIDEHGVVVDTQEERPEWESAISLIWNRWDSRNKQFIGDFCYNTDYLKKAGGYYKLPLAWGSDDITAVMAARERGVANTQTFCFQYRDNGDTISSNTSNARIKMLATRSQYEWFAHFFQAIDTNKLSNDDRRLLDTIDKPRKRFFFNSVGKNCTDYIKGNPLRLAWCFRQLKPFHFSFAAYAKWYVSSIYHLIF